MKLLLDFSHPDQLIVKGYADIPPAARARLGEIGEFSTDIKEGPILAQSWFVLDRIRATVEAAGGRKPPPAFLSSDKDHAARLLPTRPCAYCWVTRC